MLYIRFARLLLQALFDNVVRYDIVISVELLPCGESSFTGDALGDDHLQAMLERSINFRNFYLFI